MTFETTIFKHLRFQISIFYILLDEESEFNVGLNKSGTQEGGMGRGAGSEHSNDTENVPDHHQKDVSAIYDEYREIFSEYNLSDRDQVLILKSFENKSESDIKLFIQ